MWIDALKEMKQKSGMTTMQIAAGAGVPRPTLEKYFREKQKTLDFLLCKSSPFLGYTLEDLYKDKKGNPPASPEDEEGELTVDEVVSAFVTAGIVPEGKDLSDADLRFLLAIMDAIDRWFAN